MLMSKIFDRFVEKTPVSVMARAAMEHAMAPEALFVKHADKQYTRELLFSSVIDLMGVVVSKVAPSVHAADQEVAETLPVSITSVYNKLNKLEPCVTSALVCHTACRLAPVVLAMGGQLPALLPGYRVRIIDGNHLAATERRLHVLLQSKAGPLPGHSLVVLDPALMLATHMIPCEDGHAQERSLFPEILALEDSRGSLWLLHRERGASDGLGNGHRGRTSRLGGVPDDEPRHSREGAAALGYPCEVAKAQAPSARGQEARAEEDSTCR